MNKPTANVQAASCLLAWTSNGVRVFAFTCAIMLLPIDTLAQSESLSCNTRDGAVARLPAAECATLNSASKAPTMMIYQDAEAQVLMQREGTSRTGELGEAVLVINLRAPQTRSGMNDSVRSLQRRQKFDCRAGTRAVLEERIFHHSAARGEPLAAVRTPDAPMKKPTSNSLDAAILAALCRAF